MNPTGDKHIHGPSIILNDGSLQNTSLSTPNQFGKHSLVYYVYQSNRSYLELVKIIDNMLKRQGFEDGIGTDHITLPWKLGKGKDKDHVLILASTKSTVPVIDWQGNKVAVNEARDGVSCKVNIKPSFYDTSKQVVYRTPDGTTGTSTVSNIGVTLMLNGVMLHDDRQTTEDMF